MATTRRVNGLFNTSATDAPGTVTPGTPNFLLNQPLQATSVSAPAPRVNGLLNSNAGNSLAGLQAGQATPGTDFTSSAVSIGGATAIGALAGGPVGAGVAFLSSALNSWLSVRGENKRKRETEKFIREVEAKNAKREAQNRKDNLRQIKFNRQDTERAASINAFNTKRTLLVDAINNNQNLKERFIQTGIR